ncbi:hypothetical protein BKA69DRAFT_1088364 [Paraphysoderma sedebokerense]|nr:hypothetical protein BKA69DRAFT_1088364 [Paraphysoderma sedebokerense]
MLRLTIFCLVLSLSFFQGEAVAVNSRLTTEEKKFVIDLACDSPKNTCDKVGKAFINVAEMIERVIVISQPISVQAKFHSFCSSSLQNPGNGFGLVDSVSDNLPRPAKVRYYQTGPTVSKCDNADYLGFASPAGWVEARGQGDQSIFSYPQALAKQLKMGDQRTYTPFDITAEFNAEYDWWFEGDQPITESQFDLEATVLHELLHGLGFGLAGWATQFDTPEFSNAKFIAPLVKGDSTFQGWEVAPVFARHLVEVTTPIGNVVATLASNARERSLMDSYNMITRYNTNVGRDYTTWIRSFNRSAEYAEAVRLNRVMTTSNTILFRMKSGKRVPLETSLTPFVTGSSLSHISLSMKSSPEFLMMFQGTAGATLPDQIKKSQAPPSAAIGPVILEMLETMGYQVNYAGLNNANKNTKGKGNQKGSGAGKNSVMWWTQILTGGCAVLMMIM